MSTRVGLDHDIVNGTPSADHCLARAQAQTEGRIRKNIAWYVAAKRGKRVALVEGVHKELIDAGSIG